MSDNPFVTPENPFGSWNLPFEPVAVTAEMTGIVVDSVDVAAAAVDTPLGLLPVLSLAFMSSAQRPEAQPPRLLFIATVEVFHNLRDLITSAIDGAIKAASE